MYMDRKSKGSKSSQKAYSQAVNEFYKLSVCVLCTSRTEHTWVAVLLRSQLLVIRNTYDLTSSGTELRKTRGNLQIMRRGAPTSLKSIIVAEQRCTGDVYQASGYRRKSVKDFNPLLVYL